MELIVAVAATSGQKDTLADDNGTRQPTAGKLSLPPDRLGVIQLCRQIRLFAHPRTVVAAELTPVFGAGGL